MKRLLGRVICLFVLARTAWAFDPFTVRDIRVEGIQRIEAGTVFSYLPVKVGETMTDEKASQAIRALYGTGFFRDVRLEVDQNVLLVVVEERPAIASIDFVGMKEFDKEQVKKGLRDVGFQEGRTFDRAQLEAGRAGDQTPIPDTWQVRGRGDDHGHAAGTQSGGHQLWHRRG